MEKHKPTHEIMLLDKKPSPEEINQMTATYYQDEGADYDKFNEAFSKRKLFMEAVNKVIAANIKDKKIESVFTVGCATGLREDRIASEIHPKPKVVGVDFSEKMCALATTRGFEMHCGEWPGGVDRSKLKDFGLALMLNYLGASPTREHTEKTIKAIYDVLRPGGYFFVDVMNIDDESEWGPELKRLFKEKNLKERGYDLGDVFFRRVDKTNVAFFHYYSTEEMKELCAAQGLKHLNTWYVGASPTNAGELVERTQGTILLQFQR